MAQEKNGQNAQQNIVLVMCELSDLALEAVKVLREGMQSKDVAHRFRCATAVLSHVAKLENYKESRWAVEPSNSEILSHML